MDSRTKKSDGKDKNSIKINKSRTQITNFWIVNTHVSSSDVSEKSVIVRMTKMSRFSDKILAENRKYQQLTPSSRFAQTNSSNTYPIDSN